MTNATQDYGDLRVTMTSALDWIWNDLDSGATTDFEAYHPRSQGNLRPLGSVGFSSYGDRNGKFAVILVGNNPSSTGKPAVASPTGYDQIWRDEESGGEYDGSFWRPRAPSGYVALGDVCQRYWNTPSTDIIWCVRSDLVQDSNYFRSKVWDDHMSGATLDCSVWDIGLPSLGVNGSANIPISTNTFRANNNWSEPNNSLAQVLVLPNPKKFVEFTTPPPKFTKNNLPKGGDIFNCTDQCQVTLPFTVYFPPTDAASLRAISNPFCTLSRRIAWYVHTVHINDGGGTISDSTTVTKGVSNTLSKEMTQSAGVSISASYGIMGFGMDVSLNYQFTSTISSSFTEYEETSRTQEYTVPPYEASIFLSKRIWIQASRADGSIVLREINFNANEDIHLIGVPLK
ncbi:b8d55a13-8c93-4da6-9244-2b852eb643f6-CDS [Sclerotinia trifoliorum]|uniref:B8d55a13-8c93-4da6-9244-2b852eb643f6-CDS n=1 Tax=Sclerotinia trifoliorum TaxID=28548 RepID=A0A8H2ZM19_9HELO|nr:b8d55a13-8c93-4da6-9244-2b852eb643f6-CDS [Sclerotinia trifoliorum]